MTKEGAAREDLDEDSPEEQPEKTEEKTEEQPKIKKTSLKAVSGGFSSKIAVFVIAGLVIGILVGQVALPGLGIGLIALPSDGSPGSTDMAALQAKVESYLNENVLNPQGVEGKIISIEPYDEDFYSVKVEILRDGESLAEQEIFLTRSGNALSGTVLFLDEAIEQPEPQPQPQPQPTDVPKSDKPIVELFIMSYCPYGLQMQKATLPVMELLGDKADIKIKFVSYIMHEWKEIAENNTQYCIQKEQPEKLVNYLKCFTQTDDSTACLATAGINAVKLNSCIAAADQEFGITAAYEDKASWTSGRFPQYNVHKALNDKYGVGGSPTMVINGTTVSVTRSPEAVKQAICDAFNTAPAECSQTLSTASASPGIGGGTASNNTDAGCAT